MVEPRRRRGIVAFWRDVSLSPAGAVTTAGTIAVWRFHGWDPGLIVVGRRLPSGRVDRGFGRGGFLTAGVGQRREYVHDGLPRRSTTPRAASSSSP